MTFQSVVRRVRSQSPDFDGAIQTGTGKGVGILGIKLDLHDVMCVSFEHLRAIKTAIPVPQLDRHIITARQHIGKGGMDLETTNIIGVGFKFLDFFHRVVVKDTKAHIVGSGQEPLLSCDKLGTSYGQLADFKGLDTAAGFVIPNHDISAVQGGEDPGFIGVEIHTLDALRRGG